MKKYRIDMVDDGTKEVHKGTVLFDTSGDAEMETTRLAFEVDSRGEYVLNDITFIVVGYVYSGDYTGYFEEN